MLRFQKAARNFGDVNINRVGVLAAACVIIGLGCADVSEPLPDVPSVSQTVAALQGEELSTLQREWSKIAQRAPGFAGMFLDDQGSLVVRTVNMSEEAVLHRAVQPFVQPFQAQISRTSIQPAEYSFAQLVRWHNAVRRDLRGTAGWTSIYIDYVDNRIGIGFALEHEAGVRAATLAAVGDNGVPKDAVFSYPVTITLDIDYGPPPSATRSGHTLVDVADTLVGGLFIDGETGGSCTMTLNVRWPLYNNRKMWLTNAHCTREIGQTELGEWWQPSSPARIGGNAVDRLFGGNDHGFADASMQWKDTFTPNRHAAVGMIARTIDVAEGPNNRGSLEIRQGVGPREVTQVAIAAFPGARVLKTGARTGTTRGTVTRIDQTYERAFNTHGGTWELREQTEATYWSEGGDSGSPVWAAGNTGVILLGQHWGRTSRDPQTSRAIYSLWDQVEHMVGLGSAPVRERLCETVDCE